MSKSNPLVSIIITCYNYGGYVGECIDSVLNQTYENIELIVINDGSTDNSLDVIRSKFNKNNFKIINQQNKGVIKTRNRAILESSGEYIIQLDADDYLDQKYVEKLLEAAFKNNAQITYSQSRVFGRVNFITNFPDFNIETIKHDGYINAAALVHRDVFTDRKYDMYLNDKGNEDWDLFLDACLDGFRALLVNEPLHNYRKHKDLISRADKFELTINEVSARHHILNKQNAKHPKHMWYFSPYIKTLENYIHISNELNNLRNENTQLNILLNKYQEYPGIKIARALRNIFFRIKKIYWREQ